MAEDLYAGLGTDQSRKQRARLAEFLSVQGASTAPVQHWTQGLGRVAQALMGGYMGGETQREAEQAAALERADALAKGKAHLGAQYAALAERRRQFDIERGDKEAQANAYREALARALGRGGGAVAAAPAPGGVLPWPEQGGAIGQPPAPVPSAPSPAPAAPDAGVQVASIPPMVPDTSPGPQQAPDWLKGAALPSGAQPVPAPARAAPQIDQGTVDAINAVSAVDPKRALKMAIEAGSAGAKQFRAMTQAEKDAYGIPKSDMRPYQIGPNGQIHAPQAGPANEETAFNKKFGEEQAKQFTELIQDVPQSKQMISDVKTLGVLGQRIGTGQGAIIKSALGPYAQMFGINIKGLSDIQAYEAIVNRVAPQLRVKGSGAQSDLELTGFMKSIPSLRNTPDGNVLIEKTLSGFFDNKVRAAEIANKAGNREISISDANRMIAELPDPLEQWRTTTGNAIAKPNKFTPGTREAEEEAARIDAEIARRPAIGMR